MTGQCPRASAGCLPGSDENPAVSLRCSILWYGGLGYQISGPTNEPFLLDLEFCSAALGYSGSGRVLRTERAPDCSPWVQIRDVTRRAALQSGRPGRTDAPVLIARNFAEHEIGRYPFASPDVQDIRLSTPEEKVALAGEPGGPGLGCKTGVFIGERGAANWAACWGALPTASRLPLRSRGHRMNGAWSFHLAGRPT